MADDLAALNDAAAIAEQIALTTNAIRQAVADSIMGYAATVEG